MTRINQWIHWGRKEWNEGLMKVYYAYKGRKKGKKLWINKVMNKRLIIYL